MATPPPWRISGTSYIAVEARRTLGSSMPNSYAPTPAKTLPAESGTRTTFPDPLKQYVARTFEDIQSKDRPEVEAELKRIITEAFNEKVVWSIDWDKMPLPQTIIAARALPSPRQALPPQSPVLREKNGSAMSYGNYVTADKKRQRSRSPISKKAKRNRFHNNGEKDLSSKKFADKEDKRNDQQSPRMPSPDKLSKDKRAKRFAKEWKYHKNQLFQRSQSDAMEVVSEGPVVGRCMQLEKRYLRLTSAPDPENVRPPHILEKTLELLKRKWRDEQNYAYVCDQFKSLRQDLTVQHIKNEFTVTVYEIHARIALEKGDLGEYNQCQSQLANLYSEGIRGHREEFKAYRILYLLHTCNRSDMNEMLATLTPTDKQHSFVKHALRVRSALATGNYHGFFKLYLEGPGMGGYMMDSFVARERIASLASICKAYRPDIDVRFLTEELGFESDAECVQFLCDNGATDFISQTSGDKGVPTSIRFQTSKALPNFEERKRNAFKKVDIKGQM